MRKYFNLSYPFYYDIKTSIIISILVFVLSTLFSILFEPFEVNYKELKFSFLFISIIHSAVSFIVFMSSVFVLNVFRDNKNDWKLKNEFSFLFLVLLIIGISQFLIRDLIYLKEDNWSFKYLVEEIRNTILVGGLLIFVITSINIERLKNIYIKKGKDLDSTLNATLNKVEKHIEIKTQVISDDFTLNLNNFLYAKSDKNYLEIYLEDNLVLLKRITIKSFEEQLSYCANICRVHRSYIINLKIIIKVTGNSQGLQLWINDKDYVPVSRKLIPEFEYKFKNQNL